MFNKKLCSFGLAIFTLFPLSASKFSICKAIPLEEIFALMDPIYYFGSNDPIKKRLIERCHILLDRFSRLNIPISKLQEKEVCVYRKRFGTKFEREAVESLRFLCFISNEMDMLNSMHETAQSLDMSRLGSICDLNTDILEKKILFIRKFIKFLLKFENTNHLQVQVSNYKNFSFGGHVLNLYDIRHKSFVLESIFGGKNVLYGVLPYNERNDVISLAIALCKHINYYFNFFLTEAFDLCDDTLTKHEK